MIYPINPNNPSNNIEKPDIPLVPSDKLPKTTITLFVSTKILLDDFKVHYRETSDDVLLRLLKELKVLRVA